jgi:aspartokinase-like uncharacterized kinase
MIVIKLGGSLVSANTLLHCLNRIEQQYQDKSVVIVPGGGAFADQVRIAQQHWQFDDYHAHAMALLAMQQMAWLIHGLKPDFVIADSVRAIKQQREQKIIIWSPELAELNKAGIPASWNITSDSLAAWLAKSLSADELILIKSAVIDKEFGLAELSNRGIIDKGFCNSVTNSRFIIRVLNQQNF